MSFVALRFQLIGALLASSALPAFAQVNATLKAAAKFMPEVHWKTGSALMGDFACHRQIDHALVGVDATNIIVAVFLGTLSKPPQVLRFSKTARSPETAKLTLEDGDFDPKQFERELGYLPDGMRPSKTCKGLALSDGEVDAAHIYWNHNAKVFSAWVL